MGSIPAIVKTKTWDGNDGEIIEKDEFSLEELMGEDALSILLSFGCSKNTISSLSSLLR